MYAFVESLVLVVTLAVAALWLQDPTRDWAEPLLALLAALVALMEFFRRRHKSQPTPVDAGAEYILRPQADGTTVVEGVVKVGMATWGAVVTLPPFAQIPDIDILPTDPSKTVLPVIQDKTKNSFALKILSSSEAGTWRWRAHGKLLD